MLKIVSVRTERVALRGVEIKFVWFSGALTSVDAHWHTPSDVTRLDSTLRERERDLMFSWFVYIKTALF